MGMETQIFLKYMAGTNRWRFRVETSAGTGMSGHRPTRSEALQAAIAARAKLEGGYTPGRPPAPGPDQ